MPKRAIYLPDDLDAAARAAGIPLSLVCQQAIRAQLDGQPATVPAAAAVELRDDAGHHPGSARPATQVQLAAVAAVAILGLVLAVAALRTSE